MAGRTGVTWSELAGGIVIFTLAARVANAVNEIGKLQQAFVYGAKFSKMNSSQFMALHEEAYKMINEQGERLQQIEEVLKLSKPVPNVIPKHEEDEEEEG
jgi:nitrous oxide reductase